jgi:hypothetical protein
MNKRSGMFVRLVLGVMSIGNESVKLPAVAFTFPFPATRMQISSSHIT